MAFGPFAGIFNWCFDNIPFFKGYREPQKFIGLLILAYSYLGAIGVQWLAGTIKDQFRSQRGRRAGYSITITILMLLPIAYTYPMFWGFDNQLRVVSYPADWNPSQLFFEKPIIKGDTLEFGSSFDQNVPAINKAIEAQVLNHAALLTDAGPRLAQLNVKYILLAKTEELPDYGWLNRQPDLELLSDGSTLQVYLNRSWQP